MQQIAAALGRYTQIGGCISACGASQIGHLRCERPPHPRAEASASHIERPLTRGAETLCVDFQGCFTFKLLLFCFCFVFLREWGSLSTRDRVNTADSVLIGSVIISILVISEYRKLFHCQIIYISNKEALLLPSINRASTVSVLVTVTPVLEHRYQTLACRPNLARGVIIFGLRGPIQNHCWSTASTNHM